ncbi:IS5 family transposase [Pelagibius sp.]|uniref:IS5 family transposase n=1 Tax=Pelagibius sp. TaxID=1931238 RepID=UPI003BAE3795
MARLYWLSDEEWARIEPYLPRGRRGAHRVDDRRVISGIVHMLKVGARWRDCPSEYDPYTTIYNRFNRWSKQGVWEDIFYALTGKSVVVSTTAVDSTHIKAHRSAAGAKGDFEHAIGRSRGGRTTKIHAITDALGRPIALSITPGQTHDLVGAAMLLERIPTPKRLLADRAYDAAKLRDWLIERGCQPVIPPNPTRKHPQSYDKVAYRDRNRVERMFCRLKDFRRIATRYDKRADIFLAAICLAASITWWLN